MANNYRLTIHDVYGKGKDLKLTYNQGQTSSQVIKINYIDCTFTLKNFSYTKAIYQPGEIQITLILTKEKDSFSLSDVKAVHSSLINRNVKLEFSESSSMSNAFEIAKNYYTFDIQIERKKGSSGILSVNIKAFDPLKFLTLDKYCMAYTCKKLIMDIISQVDLWPNALPEELKEAITNDRKSITEKETNIKNLKKDPKKNKEAIEKETKELNTAIQNWWTNENGFFIKNPQFISYKKDNNYFEFIQPYLVQYNESFLDFLVRVTNRCGEFFYYEKGKIHIGWKETDSIISIKDYVSVRFPKEISTAWSDNAIADIHNDYTQKEDKNLKNINETPTMMRDYELASDENLASIPPKEDYTSWKDFALYPGCFYVNLVSDALCTKNLVDMIMDLGVSTAATISSSKNISNDANDAYETQNFSGTYKDERMQEDNIYPFSTNDTNKSGIKDKQVAYSLAYYTNIQKGIESTERSRIQIELGDYFYKVSLGSIVKFDGDEYIVVKIDSQIDSQDTDGEALNIEVIPYTNGENIYPPSAHVDSIRSAKAQRAIVTHNQDPLKMNRVRVRYPWQGTTDSTTSEDSTPWIRIALPMASDGSGFNFLPEVGDEAMINFENGNIERPYVEGMLYSNGQTVPGDYKRNGARFITSVNGHSIIFSDPGKMNVLRTISPVFKTIGSFMGTPEISINDRKAMGGIELTDEYGLYSIAMSSSSRSITISSPLGNVSINAFTGIKISAPNGNISIEGKNINIAAGNNLTLSSGNNIKSHFWPYYKKDGFLKSLLNAGVGLLKSAISKFNPIDMGLVRTVMETFLRPIGGTMLIKSNRYMCIEAGEGKAQIAGRQIVNNFWPWQTLFHAYKPQAVDTTIRYKENAVATALIPKYLNDAINNIDSICDICNKAFTEIKPSLTNIINAYSILNYPNPYYEIENPDAVKDLKTLLQNISTAPEKIKYRTLKIKATTTTIPDVVRSYNVAAEDIFNKVMTKEKLDNLISEKFSTNSIQTLILNDSSIKKEIELLFNDMYIPNISILSKSLTLDLPQKRKVAYLILKKLISLQSEVKDITNIDKIRLSQIGKPKGYDYQQWSEFVNKIDKIFVKGKRLNAKKIGLKTWEIASGTLSLGLGFDKLDGVFDQYIWDSNEDSGKILFSDSKGKTLNFNNDTIHYYKKLETADPIKEIKDTLSGI